MDFYFFGIGNLALSLIGKLRKLRIIFDVTPEVAFSGKPMSQEIFEFLSNYST